MICRRNSGNNRWSCLYECRRHGTEIADVLVKARVLVPDGRLEWIDTEKYGIFLSQSRLQKEKGICVQAVFSAQRRNKRDIVAEMQKT